VKPARTPFTNRIYKLQGGTKENDLPVEMNVDVKDVPVMISTWVTLDEAERERLVSGAPIELIVWGEAHPPVAIRVANYEEEVISMHNDEEYAKFFTKGEHPMVTTPQLDYYVGRSVEAVLTYGEGDWDWGIQFPGNVAIRNTDKRRTSVPEVDGLVFMSVGLSEDETRMMFGTTKDGGAEITQVVSLSPLQYSITDGNFEGGPHFPQRPTQEEVDSLPPDPSEERVVEAAENAALESHRSDAEATGDE